MMMGSGGVGGLSVGPVLDGEPQSWRDGRIAWGVRLVFRTGSEGTEY